MISSQDWCETQTAELLREVETQKKSADKAAAATQLSSRREVALPKKN